MGIISDALKCVMGRAYFPVCLRSTGSCAEAWRDIAVGTASGGYGLACGGSGRTARQRLECAQLAAAVERPTATKAAASCAHSKRFATLDRKSTRLKSS